MKAMKTAPRALTRLLAVIVCLMTVLALVGCSTGQTKIDTSFQEGDSSAVIYFARILKLDTAARERFVAASRGYDMLAEGFDDSKIDPTVSTEPDVEAAKKALEKLKPADFADAEKFEQFKNALTAQEVTEIVEDMRETVDFEPDNGPIDTILVWIGKFVSILTKVTGGKYVFGLFLFAIVVEILMLPFGIKQQKTSLKQAKLRPKEMAIRKKYAGRNDQATQQKMSQEIQKMYQEEGYNPMGGCLPLLIQLPIVMALYQIVINPLRYVLGMSGGISNALTTYCGTARAAGGLGLKMGAGKGTIELLSQMSDSALQGLENFAYFGNGADCVSRLRDVNIPDFSLFGLNMGEIPDLKKFGWLWLVPVLTFVFYFASMKLTRKFTYQPQADDPQMGCSNKMMDLTMPLMSVYISFIVPAAVGIYWIFKSVISTLKQFIIHKAMPIPPISEEEYKAAERELKGKSSKSPAKRPAGAPRTNANGTPVRSLHHIDDDDEPLPPPGQVDFEKIRREAAEKKAAEEAAAAETAEKVEEKATEVPNLKDDRKNHEKDEK